MKAFFTFLFLILIASLSNAQWIINGFESAAADSIFFYAPGTPGLASGTGSLVLTDVTDPVHSGSKAMKVDYVVHSSESYGGYTEFQYLRPQDGTFFDWSSAAKLRLWYYVVTPYSTGSIYFRLKILESGGSANYQASRADHEDWYFQGSDIYGAAPGWNYIDMPLVDRGGGSPNAEGFSLTGWSGTTNNSVLDFDKIVGWMVDFITDGISNNGTATGTVVFDDFQFIGTKYPPVSTFDSTASNNYFVIDQMESVGGTDVQGKLTLTDKTGADAFEGYSSLQLDVKVNNSQTWGGYVNMQHNLPSGTYLPTLAGNEDLLLYVKVLSPFTGAADRVTMRFFLYDGTGGESEAWQMTVPVDLYQSSDWQQIKLPLENKGYNTSGLVSDGFVVPSWSLEQGHGGDGVFNLSNINSWKIEFSGTGDAPYEVGEICEGSVMVDLLVPEGYRETDVTPPVPPTGLLCVPGTYSNLITWNDVPGEEGAKYNIYYSANPITEITDPLAKGVEVAQLGIVEKTNLFEHLLRAPNTDQPVSYYYAVNAVDKAGNIGLVASTPQPVTNTAKGVPTLSLDAPTTTFNADGDLSEWANIKPIVMSLDANDGSATVAPNTVIDGDADLKVTAYLAVDADYLYVAFDVEDDVVVVKPETGTDGIASYYSDSPDLFIGLYDWHGPAHGSYQRGAQPDYHFRFTKGRLRNEGGGGDIDTILKPGVNYYWGEKFPTGYVVEARIPWSFKPAGDQQFVPKEGMRIPIDFSINDNDDHKTAADWRDGIMCYSPYNNDQSWSTTARWLWTWIGNEWVVGVNDTKAKTFSYSLDQNYPNPFNPSTQIKYSIEKPGLVTLKIFDVLGRQVKELVNQFQNAGVYTVNFNATGLSSGIYLYQINAGQFQIAKKMILIK